MLGAKIILDHNPQSFVLRGRFRYCNHSVAQLLESPSEGGCVKITLAVEMSIEAAFGQPQFLHDLANAVALRPVLPERASSRRKDLLVGLRLLLRWVPHSYRITKVI